MELKYFALRGRAEAIRLALAVAGVQYYDDGVDGHGVDRAVLKAGAGTAEFPFGQVPILVDGDLNLAQMDAIMRHIGRKFSLYGENLDDAAMIDMVLGGVEDIRRAYISLIFDVCAGRLSAECKANYYTKHIDPSSIHERNGGAHFQYLNNILNRNGGGNGFIVGQKLSIADIQLFDLIDIHLREALFPTEMLQNYPRLIEFHARISAVPAIAKHISGPRRLATMNGNGLG